LTEHSGLLDKRPSAEDDPREVTPRIYLVGVLAASVALMSASCGGSSSSKYVYPKTEQDRFIAGCTSGANGHRSTCECALHWLENNVSYVDLVQTYASGAALPPSKVQALKRTCVSGSASLNLATSRKPEVTLPFVEGLPEPIAVRKLKRAGVVVHVVRRARPGVPTGTVYRQSPAAGSRATTGSAVTIFVAAARPTKHTPKPNTILTARFYSPSHNIECVFHNNEVGSEPQANLLDCGTFNNHKAIEIDSGDGGPHTPFPMSWSNEFRPGEAPVVSYGSTWSRGGFTCRSASTGMTCFVNSTGHGFTIDRNGTSAYPAPASPPPSPPPPPSSSQPQYVLADAVQQALTENGIDDSAGHEQVLTVECSGSGYPGPNKTDQYGISQPTYHIFQCLFSTSTIPGGIMRVDTYAGNGQYDFTYQYAISS
jgi:PASTA domain